MPEGKVRFLLSITYHSNLIFIQSIECAFISCQFLIEFSKVLSQFFSFSILGIIKHGMDEVCAHNAADVLLWKSENWREKNDTRLFPVTTSGYACHHCIVSSPDCLHGKSNMSSLMALLTEMFFLIVVLFEVNRKSLLHKYGNSVTLAKLWLLTVA